ncbi:MAG: hypothetical protein Q8O67_05795 [Deltaproteobacteria bacterium]|nr:hypothetical protein [Deltaproteobacteria bacterium]
MHRFVVVVVVVCAACPAPPITEGEGDEGEGEGEEGEGEGEGELAGCVDARQLERRDISAAVVVGDGSSGSCTEAAFDAALASVHAAGGGSIAFSCGGSATLALSTEKSITVNVVVDGGGDVVLDAGGVTRIFVMDGNFESPSPRLTLQDLALAAGAGNGDGGDPRNGGGAVFRQGGTLEVIGCTFTGNRAPAAGQDVAGGAIMSIGGGFTLIRDSAFDDNRASNGGALGNLGNDLVVESSTFSQSQATGSGGNPGNGGNGGAISVDGEGRRVEVCRSSIAASRANAFGGGFFRVAYAGEPTVFESVNLLGNEIADGDPSMAGAIYIQNSAFSLRRSIVRSNKATSAGGVYAGPGTTLDVENTIFSDNTALASLAGAMFLDGVAGGTIRASSFLRNRAPGPLAFGGGITGNGAGVVVTGSLFLDHEAGNGFNPITCTTQLEGGAGSFQFPVTRLGNGGGDGGSDAPGSLCAPNISAVDVDVDDEDVPLAGSVAVGANTDCPAVDLRGAPRPNPCTSGALER